MKSKLILMLLFIVHSCIQGQSIQEILNNRLAKTELANSHQSYINGIDRIKYRYPLIEEINLRTESDQNNLARQEYALRFMFNNFGLSKTFKKEANIIKQKISIELQKIEQDVLYDLYRDLIKLHFYKIEDSLNTFRIEQDKANIDYLISLIKSGTTVNAKDILRLESDIYENKGKTQVLKKNIDEVIKKWHLTSQGLALKMAEKDIYSIIHSIDIKSIRQTFFLENSLEQELDNIEYLLDKKDKRRILDFFQLRYSKRDNLLFQDEFSLGLGLRLPYSGSHVKDAARYKSNQLENSFNLSIDKIKIEFELVEKIESFDEIYNELTFIRSQQIDRFSTLNTNHFENINAIEMFKKDLKLAYTEKTMELSRKLWLSYIEILYKAELLNTLNILK